VSEVREASFAPDDEYGHRFHPDTVLRVWQPVESQLLIRLCEVVDDLYGPTQLRTLGPCIEFVPTSQTSRSAKTAGLRS